MHVPPSQHFSPVCLTSFEFLGDWESIRLGLSPLGNAKAEVVKIVLPSFFTSEGSGSVTDVKVMLTFK